MNDKMKYVARWLFVGHAANAAKHNLQQTFHRAASLPLFLSILLPYSNTQVFTRVSINYEREQAMSMALLERVARR